MSAEALVTRSLADAGRRLVFTEARTSQHFLPKDVPEDKLRELYDLWKWGPTAANCLPMRVLYVKSEAAKEKLLPGLMDSNKDKSKDAPVVAVLAYDANFFDHFPTLMPPMAYLKDYMKGNAEAAEKMAKQSALLQAGYFIIAARAVGLDAGPMGGFDGPTIDKALFEPHEGSARANWKTVLVVNLGYGDVSKVYPRNHRFDFDEVNIIE